MTITPVLGVVAGTAVFIGLFKLWAIFSAHEVERLKALEAATDDFFQKIKPIAEAPECSIQFLVFLKKSLALVDNPLVASALCRVRDGELIATKNGGPDPVPDFIKARPDLVNQFTDAILSLMYAATYANRLLGGKARRALEQLRENSDKREVVEKAAKVSYEIIQAKEHRDRNLVPA